MSKERGYWSMNKWGIIRGGPSGPRGAMSGAKTNPNIVKKCAKWAKNRTDYVSGPNIVKKCAKWVKKCAKWVKKSTD